MQINSGPNSSRVSSVRILLNAIPKSGVRRAVAGLPGRSELKAERSDHRRVKIVRDSLGNCSRKNEMVSIQGPE